MKGNDHIPLKLVLNLAICSMLILGIHSLQAQNSQDNNIEQLSIGEIVVEGNKITKRNIIVRELLFHEGDVIPAAELDSILEHSRQNIMNTSLFNRVDIEASASDQGDLRIKIVVVEQWYIWPIPILKLSDRNFNVWWETRDLGRLSYGVTIDWRNFRGRRENLQTTLQFGFDELIHIDYLAPYINQKQTIGMGFGAGVGRNREVHYKTYENKQQFLRSDDGYLKKEANAYYLLLLRPNIYNIHTFELGFDHQWFSDSLNAANPYYADQMSKVNYFTIRYKYKSDYRDYKSYPLEGYYFDVELVKHGLGLFKDNTIDFGYFTTTFRKYWKISKRFYYSAGLNAKFSTEKHQPFFKVRAIGYDRDIVRGYEYYVVDGQDFGILKSNIKFAIIPKRTSQIKWIKSEKFSKIFYGLYTNLFLDFGFALNREFYGENNNSLQNELLLGYGAGIDFITYYDIVIRAEFSINKMGETGFYLHFRAPI